ncbi:hypothetical protein NDU88_004926 [Pleurodeles waltl]|uniref:Uncharacterized protein n=1 Tax=Pleurodeles waltl TaxID=8319 RepID=A0AAV7TA63_PLEWA|nr:hypothetical protein NDU88_004926 [Pleurodeles waltl]
MARWRLQPTGSPITLHLPERVGLLRRGHGEMALTKEDLVSSLHTFKVELRKELTDDFKATLDAFQSDINSRLTSLQADVDSVGTCTFDLEAQVQEMKQQVNPMEREFAHLKSQLQLAILKCGDQENCCRRDNSSV